MVFGIKNQELITGLEEGETMQLTFRRGSDVVDTATIEG